MTATFLTWSKPPSTLHLTPDDVHLWGAWLSQSDTQLAEQCALLSPDEQQRAGHMQAGLVRRRFIAGRGLLRVVLGRYLGRRPQRLRFAYGTQGKPRLAPELGSAPRFNLAHSHEMILLAVSAQRELGIDVEWIRPLSALQRLAGKIMAPGEARRWQGLQEEQKLPAFFEMWTRKEALVKGMGAGLTVGLRRIDVTPTMGTSPVRVDPMPDLAGPVPWSIHTLDLRQPEYIAAVAIADDKQELSWQQFQFSGPWWDVA